jgi:RNA polymerase sigma factor (sigma-70 family)
MAFANARDGTLRARRHRCIASQRLASDRHPDDETCARNVTMDDNKILAERFAGSRTRLRSIAYRMLGSASEAEDAVQEAWLRLMRAEGAGVENLTAWLTTVVARICLDMLRARKSRREEPLGAEVDELPAAGDAEQDKQIADSVGVAMLVVLETLPPAERVLSSCTTCSIFPSTPSRRSSADRRRRPGNSRAADAAAFRARRRRPTRIA